MARKATFNTADSQLQKLSFMKLLKYQFMVIYRIKLLWEELYDFYQGVELSESYIPVKL